MIKTHIPNIITALRIALCIPMFFAEAMSPLFVSCYLLAGVSDMLDGFLARKLCVTSDFGARLDSVADLVFAIIMASYAAVDEAARALKA